MRHVLKLDENRTGPYPAGDEYARSNPQWIDGNACTTRNFGRRSPIGCTNILTTAARSPGIDRDAAQQTRE